MSDFDDYKDEMRDLEWLSDDDIDRLLAGKAPASQNSLSELAVFFEDVRRAGSGDVNEVIRGAHLAAIVEEASFVESEPAATVATGPPDPSTWRRVMHRTTSFALKLAAGAGAGVLSLAGLAYAGVDLPGTATEDAVEDILQIELPNQEDSKSRSAEVEETKESFGDERGCEFGQAVAATASANRQDGSNGSEQDPCVKGDEGKAAKEEHGKSGDAPGRAEDKVRGKSGDAPGRAEDKPKGKSADAPGKAEDKPKGKSADAPGQAEDKVKGKSADAPAGNAGGSDNGNGKDKTGDDVEEPAGS